MSELIDAEGENRAVRAFLLLYGGSAGVTTTQMRRHMEASGYPLWPEWAAHADRHLTKGGAQDWLRHLFALEVSAQPAQASDLVERCREILAWKSTGLLPGNALRAFAKVKWGDDHMALSLAEADTMKEALEVLVSQPAQAGQVHKANGGGFVHHALLSTDEWFEFWNNCDNVDGESMFPEFLALAQDIEQAVLAKRVPMTDELHTFINAAAGEGFVLDGVDAADLYIKLFPEAYAKTVASIDGGIVGEKGGA